MFDAADASDALATSVTPGARDAQVSNVAIKSDFEMALSWLVVRGMAAVKPNV